MRNKNLPQLPKVILLELSQFRITTKLTVEYLRRKFHFWKFSRKIMSDIFYHVTLIDESEGDINQSTVRNVST